ncbi:unnamed protein product [Darwinula stevensoni]|uniref:Major facilitator superfamily (MFS) profile domain-containing protein n=1 Tax=Darwinula stevensoni TaxID=69355 RepID=A0A7R9FSY0_9CRUS|nr:unnamed protein product [Darwinula stevensoni]CAG0903503.1 unnamed protein product [Darwinula stevensoni]
MNPVEYVEKSRFGNALRRCRESRRLVLVIVAIALLLDNMLLTAVVPIIPSFLAMIRQKDDEKLLLEKNLTRTAEGDAWNDYDNFTSSTSIPHDTEELPPCHVNETRASGKLEHYEIVNENVEVGFLFSSKAFIQLIANPLVGPLTNRIGYSMPMFVGFIIMFLSTVIFAFGRTYGILFIARALQGIGSSCSSVSGMGMLAERYPDEQERGNAMGIALGGLALGVMIGPPFGGFMFEFVGKSAPFLVLAFLALADGMLQLLMLQPRVKKQEQEGASLMQLIMDPYVCIAAGAITFANMGIAMLEPSLPLWMKFTMCAPVWQHGAVFLPASISYLIGTNVFGPLGHRMGRWLASMLGLIIVGICLMLVPQATEFRDLMAPMAGLGFSIGMVDSCIMPELGHLVDLRHSAVYGTVYAIGDVAFCLGFAVGPALSGELAKNIGFDWMLYLISFICFVYSPLLFFIRSPPTREEKKKLGNENFRGVLSLTELGDERPPSRTEDEPLLELAFFPSRDSPPFWDFSDFRGSRDRS